MQQARYWLALYTPETWGQFVAYGGDSYGVRDAICARLNGVAPGDFLLCYITKISRFVAIMRVESKPYRDETPIWTKDVFPCRVKVSSIVRLTPETAVPVYELLDRFTWWPTVKQPDEWTGRFKGSIVQIKAEDALLIESALRAAETAPTVRALNVPKGKPPPVAGVAHPPTTEPPQVAEAIEPMHFAAEISATASDAEPEDVAKKVPAHREMQWLLGKLANDLGLTVWLPPGDRGFEYDGHRFSDLNLAELPMMFGPKVLRTVRNIDVIWLGEGSVEAAFEIESTTSIYSGILRMADLIALVPGITIPLYIVAPDERRKNVYREVTRPAFSKLSPAMRAICRYVPFSAIRNGLPPEAHRRFTSPQFIRTLSEECVPE